MQLHGVITSTLHLRVADAYDSAGISSVKLTSALNQPLSLRIAYTRAVVACSVGDDREVTGLLPGAKKSSQVKSS